MTKTATTMKARKTSTGEEAERPQARPEAKDLTVYDAVGRTPGVTIAQIATAIGWGRSTVTKSLARMTKQGLVSRTKGGHDGTKRLPDTFTLQGAQAGAAADKPAKKAAADKGTRKQSPAPVAVPAAEADRLGKGELADLVARLLAEHPSVEFGPSQIAKELNRSAGAIANALDKMTKGGAAEQVQAKPKRYKLKATT